MDGALTSTTTPGQSGSGSNGNIKWFQIPDSSKTGILPTDAVLCHTKDTLF